MDEGRRIYLPRYNLPIHPATVPGHPRHDDVTPRGEMTQDCLIAARIGAMLVSTDTVGNVSSTARDL
jgi:hypothetical protein